MHSDLLRIRIDTTRSLPICLTSQLTLSGDVERQIAQISHGAVMAGINVTKLKSIEVLVPPMPLQRKFAQLVERHARTYNHQIQAGQEAEGFFHSLVQLAFHGQL